MLLLGRIVRHVRKYGTSDTPTATLLLSNGGPPASLLEYCRLGLKVSPKKHDLWLKIVDNVFPLAPMSSFSPFEDDSVELPTVKLYLKTNPTKGRGVFAGQDIPAGTLINISPVLTFPPAANADEVAPKKGTNQISPEREVLNSYTYTWRRVDDMQALALGLGSMFNHSRNSNVCFTLDKKNSVIRYSTLVRVAQDTELCINYGPRLWFEDVDGPEEAEAEGVGEAEAESDDEDGMFGAFDLFSPGSSLPSTEASDLDSADAAAQRQCMEDVQDFDFNAAAAGSAHGKGCGRGNALGCEGDADDEAAAFGALKR